MLRMRSNTSNPSITGIHRSSRIRSEITGPKFLQEVGAEVMTKRGLDDGAVALEGAFAGLNRNWHADQVEAVAGRIGDVVAAVAANAGAYSRCASVP